MKIIAIIPARGGSKGIPLKNIVPLAGKPLIHYTILSAKNSKHIDKIVVSTDNKKIAQVAESAGVCVPFLRPKRLAGDNASTIDVIKNTLKILQLRESYIPDIVVILQPTSPLRTTSLIDKSIVNLKKSNATCVLTVSKIKKHPYSSFWYSDKYLKPFQKDFQKYYQRQKYPDLYYPTGSVYAFWRKTLETYDSIYGPRIKPIIVNDFDIDIDSFFDLFMCEMKIKYWFHYMKKNSRYVK